MSCAKTAETCGIPKASAAMVKAMMKTNQKTYRPKMLCGVWLVWALSKNCLIPPRFIQLSKPTACRTTYSDYESEGRRFESCREASLRYSHLMAPLLPIAVSRKRKQHPRRMPRTKPPTTTPNFCSFHGRFQGAFPHLKSAKKPRRSAPPCSRLRPRSRHASVQVVCKVLLQHDQAVCIRCMVLVQHDHGHLLAVFRSSLSLIQSL